MYCAWHQQLQLWGLPWPLHSVDLSLSPFSLSGSSWCWQWACYSWSGISCDTHEMGRHWEGWFLLQLCNQTLGLWNLCHTHGYHRALWARQKRVCLYMEKESFWTILELQCDYSSQNKIETDIVAATQRLFSMKIWAQCVLAVYIVHCAYNIHCERARIATEMSVQFWLEYLH